jgi:hypothetical protein
MGTAFCGALGEFNPAVNTGGSPDPVPGFDFATLSEQGLSELADMHTLE